MGVEVSSLTIAGDWLERCDYLSHVCVQATNIY